MATERPDRPFDKATEWAHYGTVMMGEKRFVHVWYDGLTAEEAFEQVYDTLAPGDIIADLTGGPYFVAMDPWACVLVMFTLNRDRHAGWASA